MAEVLSARHRAGHNADGHRLALVIEGGGNRAAYSAGMCLAIDELGLTSCFDAVYGASGGALNGAWLLTGEAQDWLPSWAWPEVVAARVNDPRRVLKGRPIVDLSVLVDHVYEHITPMAFEAILANPTTFHPIATDAHSGEPTDLAVYLTDRSALKLALWASSCLPLLAGRPVALGGRSFVDGGMAEAVPWPTAVAQGASHVVVLRTRREGQMPSGTLLEGVVLAPYFWRHGNGAGTSQRKRHVRYRAADAPCADGVQFLQMRPPADAHDVPRLSRDLSSIAAAIEIGRKTAADRLRIHR